MLREYGWQFHARGLTCCWRPSVGGGGVVEAAVLVETGGTDSLKLAAGVEVEPDGVTIVVSFFTKHALNIRAMSVALALRSPLLS